MANTANQGWAKPTVGGSEDTWGQTINDTIDAIDTLVGSVTSAEISKLDGLTSTTQELNILSGVTASSAELNYVDGVTSNIQTQIDAISAVPTGVIVIWSGAANAIPAGYTLCDGTLSTPDLRDRFIVGAGSTYTVGASGGSADAIVVDHNHTGSTNTAGSHDHTYTETNSVSNFIGEGGSGSFRVTGTSSSSTSTAGDHSHTLSVDNSGSSGTNANLPPYYSLCYIMKT